MHFIKTVPLLFVWQQLVNWKIEMVTNNLVCLRPFNLHLHDYSGPRKSSIFPGYEANNHKEVSNTMQKISEENFSREKAQSQR